MILFIFGIAIGLFVAFANITALFTLHHWYKETYGDSIAQSFFNKTKKPINTVEIIEPSHSQRSEWVESLPNETQLDL